jgi:hypothetical protein
VRIQYKCKCTSISLQCINVYVVDGQTVSIRVGRKLSGVVKKLKDLLYQLNLLNSPRVLTFSDISSPASNLYVPHSSQADPVPACIKQKAIYHCLMVQRSEEAIHQIREEMIVLVRWLAELHRMLKTKLEEIPRPLSPRDLGFMSMSTHKLLELETRMKRYATLFEEHQVVFEETPSDMLKFYTEQAEESVTPGVALTFQEVEDIVGNILAYEFVNADDTDSDGDDNDDDDI